MILEGSGITECLGWNSMCQYRKCLNLLRSRGASPRLGYWLRLVHLFVNTGVTAGSQGLGNMCCSFKSAVSHYHWLRSCFSSLYETASTNLRRYLLSSAKARL